MKATLKTFTALTVVLAVSGEAVAQSNFSPMVKPNLTNLAKPNFVKPPVIISNGVKPINPNTVKPIVRPQVARPAIAPRADVSRLAKKPNAQNRKQAERQARKQSPAKQVDTPIASIREFPPLPRSKPDRQAIAELPPLPRPKPNYDAGPQPEPPTLETNAGTSGLTGSDNGALGQVGDVAGLEAKRDILGDVAVMQELARLGGLKEVLGGNDAIDDGAMGGGGSGTQSGFGWQGLVPESNTGDAGPQNDQVWKPEAPGNSAYNRDPYGDQGGSFTPPKRGKRDGSNIPGFGQTSGNAGAGLPGRGGETSQDGGSEHSQDDGDWDKVVLTDDDGSTSTITHDGEEDGSVYHREENHDSDGNWTQTQTYYRTEHGASATIIEYANGAEYREYKNRNGDVIRREWKSPNSQPNPEDAGSGQSMPCPKGSVGCGPQSDTVMGRKRSNWRDTVAQPGADGTEPGEGAFKASVAARKDVVTNPVDPDNHIRTGGGRGPRPIEHVTGGGSGGPSRP